MGTSHPRNNILHEFINKGYIVVLPIQIYDKNTKLRRAIHKNWTTRILMIPKYSKEARRRNKNIISEITQNIAYLNNDVNFVSAYKSRTI